MSRTCQQGEHALAFHSHYKGIDYKHRAIDVMVGACMHCGKTFECRELLDVPIPEIYKEERDIP